MNNLATRLAVLALFGGMAAATPAFAQATPKTNCLNPDGTTNPFCVNQQKQLHGAPGAKGGNTTDNNAGQTPNGRHTPGNNTFTNNDNNNNGNDNNFNNNNNDRNRGRGPGNHPDFNQGNDNNGPGFDHPDRNQFRQHFRQFHYSPFPRPDFTIRPGFAVPRHFGLRPLPRELFRFYPYYRGFLFFETPDGQIVIVDPRTYRIVDII